MPIYLVDANGVKVGYGDPTPPPPDEAPAPPTGLNVVAGNQKNTLTWDANTEADLAEYRVRLTSPEDSLVAIVPAGTTTYVHEGLTNGTTYTYTVRARDAAGNTSTNSATDSGTPAGSSPTVTTIFGYNTNDDGAPLSSRLVKWDNRAPMVRRYNSSFLDSGSWPITDAVSPERRTAYSFKADSSGSFTKAGLAAGNGNDRLTALCEDIPANSDVVLTYYHEVNDDIRDNDITIAQFRDAYEQFRIAIDAASLRSGVRVRLASNFMAYKVADTPTFFSDSWVPPPDVADMMTFDIYGNPGHFTGRVNTTTGTRMEPNCSLAEGAEYVSDFPPIVTRFRDMFEAIERNGFAAHWGIQELNTPPRDWDGPANPSYACSTNKRLRYQGGRNAQGRDTSNTEVGRAAWLVAAIEHCLTPPMAGRVPPEILLLWEHPAGTNWNQKFYHNNVWNALKPYIINTPVGG